MPARHDCSRHFLPSFSRFTVHSRTPPSIMGSVANPASSRLFKPIKIGNAQLQHRVVLAPLTRVRNTDDHTPVPALAQQYYADRASVPGTLVISEATSISHDEEGQANIPGFVSDEQVAAWKQVIDAVHSKGSVWFQQLWGLGRAATPDFVASKGIKYRSASAVPTPGSDVVPAEMTEAEILDTIQAFVDTAKRVRAAGGDGVEIHGAHGYLLDQFLSDAVNKRTDKWGGSVEKRTRLYVEVIKAVSDAIGPEHVGIRLSPFASFQGTAKSDPIEQFTHLMRALKELNLPLAYISLVEPRGDPAVLFMGADQPHAAKTLDFILEIWDNQSPVLVGGGYDPESAVKAVDGHYAKWDVLIVFGRHFLANPDMPFRIRHGLPLNEYNRNTFYSKGPVGYNDYPFSDEFLAAKDKSVSV
ncbi:NADPH2 dehydrogenase [Microdochium nivale]|nr:NADPH2 dehydrogenase [Microdochium nivale]